MPKADTYIVPEARMVVQADISHQTRILLVFCH